MWERLDRSLDNNEWLIRLGGSTIHHLSCSTSDHSPLLIEIIDSTIPNKPFWFEEIRLTEKGCSDTIKSKWGKQRFNNHASGIVSKIFDWSVALKKWSSKHFGSIQKELQHKQKLLAQAELDALSTCINFQARMLKCKVNDLLDKKIRMSFQRSHSLWVVHGDKNSKYFHSRATQRHRKNRINGIKNSLGQWCIDPRVIARKVTDFYRNLFFSSNSCQPELAMEAIEAIVTEDMNKQLVADFKECEIQEALNQMAPLKSPSPDGMPPLFF